MGADLIAYILVGPKTISKARIKRAIKPMEEWAKKHMNTAVCAYCGEVQDPADLEKDAAGELILADVDCTECGSCDLVAVSSKYPDMATIARELSSIVAKWHDAPGCRDSAVRTNPDNPKEIIICCGELSWGDEPGGAGYQALKSVCQLPDDVKTILGIR